VHNHLKIQIAENMERSFATLELLEMTPVLPWQILQVPRAPAVNKTFCATPSLISLIQNNDIETASPQGVGEEVAYAMPMPNCR
jgi:hypothetical protein